MAEFKREPRYIVLKLNDIEKYLSTQAKIRLGEIGNLIAHGRKLDGKPPFNAVVVEQDWPCLDACSPRACAQLSKSRHICYKTVEIRTPAPIEHSSYRGKYRGNYKHSSTNYGSTMRVTGHNVNAASAA